MRFEIAQLQPIARGDLWPAVDLSESPRVWVPSRCVQATRLAKYWEESP
jgi:hypothetical protein